MVRRFFLLLLACVLLPAFACAGEPIRYWNGSKPEGRMAYERALLDLLLAKTQLEYGDFAVSEVAAKMSTRRLEQALVQGDMINMVEFAAGRHYLTGSNKGVSEVKGSVIQGLLGYRVSIIRKQDESRFSSVRSLDQFRRLRPGQGRDWADVAIYQLNGFSVVHRIQWESLLQHLELKQFDFLPLGVMETKPLLAARGADYPSLREESSLLIYYPFPRSFYVNSRRLPLVERLNLGFSRAEKSGELRGLFDRYYGGVVADMKASKRRLFVLKNPSLGVDHPLTQPVLLQD